MMRPIQEIVDEVHAMMHKDWHATDLNNFFIRPYEDHSSLYEYHHGFGTWIRNTYDLWKLNALEGTPYAGQHPDDVSMIIIREIWKKGPISGKKNESTS
jgi:hypothetical protein